MKLSEAFDQLEVSLGEAQSICAALIANIRDMNPDLHARLSQDIATMKAPEVEPE